MGKEITTNKKAFFEYEIEDRFEAGIVLTGPEIKSIRAGKVNLTGSHARIIEARSQKLVSIIKSKIPDTRYKIQASHPELFIINMHIETKDSDSTKTRKLLMHKSEINKLIGKTQQKSLTLIPLRLYLKNGRAKIELGLGRGKKLHDKRETIKKRDLKRSREKGEE